jgi:hypothetical protein
MVRSDWITYSTMALTTKIVAQNRNTVSSKRPEGGLVLVLDGVEPVPVEEREPDVDRHLSLVEHDERDEDAGREAALHHAERAERPEADVADRVRLEERVGDAGDGADDRDEGDQVDEDAEDADRDWQARRRHEIGEAGRPQPAPPGEVYQAEHDVLDRENGREDAQEGRDSGRAERRDGEKRADGREPDDAGVAEPGSDGQAQKRHGRDRNGEQGSPREDHVRELRRPTSGRRRVRERRPPAAPFSIRRRTSSLSSCTGSFPRPMPAIDRRDGGSMATPRRREPLARMKAVVQRTSL